MTVQTYSRADGNSSHGQNTIVHYYDKAGVKAANAVAIYAQWADKRSMPLKMGTKYKVSKWLHIYDRLIGDTDFASKGYMSSRNIAGVVDGLPALAEGAGAVNKQSISKVTIESSFARYGEMIDYTDEIEMFSEDAVQVHYREELGALANVRAEDLIQLDMLSTTTVMYAGSATSLITVGDEIPDDAGGVAGDDDATTRITYDFIRKAVRKLVRNRAPKNTTIVTGSTKVDTRVVNKAFYAIVGPEVKYDLEGIVKGSVGVGNEYAYVPAYKYADATNLAEGEVGAMNDIRFIESETAMVYSGAGGLCASTTAAGDGEYVGSLANTTHTTASAALATAQFHGTYAADEQRYDVFPILVPTKGSFATVGLKGNGKIKFNSQAPSKIELSNPYGTTGFFSYNMWYAGIILREERLLKILTAASA
jgi:N4-gp56 family major capsid protein